jgi:hypothetical protein
MNPERWYIIRLFRTSKWLFIIVLLFCWMQVYFNIKKIHSFPWFVFDMYSKVEPIADTIRHTQFYIDGAPFNYKKLPFWSGITAVRCSDYYFRMKQSAYTDPNTANVQKRLSRFPDDLSAQLQTRLLTSRADAELYPRWLLNYLSKQAGMQIQVLTVVKEEFIYHEGLFHPSGRGDTMLNIRNK